VDVQEIDAASNRGIDEIRDLRDKVRYYPVECGTKVYIVDEVHMLTEPAFNALLKTLEEPPRHVLFILATTEPHKLPATIVSRCQRFDFHRLGTELITARLEKVAAAQGVKAAPAALRMIARAADGGMRDALSLLDQCLALGGDSVDVRDVEDLLGQAGEEALAQMGGAILNQDLLRAVNTLDAVAAAGRDLRQFVTSMIQYLRDVLLLKLCGSEAPVMITGDKELQAMRSLADGFAAASLYETIEVLAAAEAEIRRSGRPRLSLELALIRLLAGGPTGAAQVEAPPTPPPVVEDLAKRWEQVIGKLKKAKQMPLCAWLQPARVTASPAGHITLAYPREYSLHKGKMEQDGSCRSTLEATVKEVFGEPLQIRVVFIEEGGDGKTEATVEDDPLVQLALELFDGEIIERQP
jgi:DNA polymerase-3 subunit gamma/tau